MADTHAEAGRPAGAGRSPGVIENDEGTIGYFDACRKNVYHAEGVRCYVAKRGLWALYQASRRPWLRQPRKLMNRHGLALVALKAGEATAVCWALADAQARRLCGARLGRSPVLQGSHRGR